MHSYYRKAKRFKLNDDLEVEDEFSGGSRRHGQPRWRDNYYGNKVGNKIKRFFRSRVGQNWDTVFSDFCKVAREEGSYGEYFLRDRASADWFSGVQLNVHMIDGYTHELPMYRRSGYRPLSRGSLYVDPATKLLCVAKGLKKEPTPSRFPPPDKTVEVGEVLFKHRAKDSWGRYCREQSYRVTFKHQTITDRKIGAGLTTHAKHKVWFKYVPYLHSWVDRWGKFVGRDESGMSIYEPVTKYEVRYHITTASKKEIKQHNLNAAE